MNDKEKVFDLISKVDFNDSWLDIKSQLASDFENKNFGIGDGKYFRNKIISVTSFIKKKFDKCFDDENNTIW